MTKQNEQAKKIEMLEEKIEMYDRALGDVSLIMCAIMENSDATVTIHALARAALCLSANDRNQIEEFDNE